MLAPGGNDQDGNLGLADNAFGDAAKEDALKHVVAVSADHDEVSAALGCEFQESLDDGGFFHESGGFHAGLLELIHEFPQRLLFLLELLFPFVDAQR